MKEYNATDDKINKKFHRSSWIHLLGSRSGTCNCVLLRNCCMLHVHCSCAKTWHIRRCLHHRNYDKSRKN